MKILISSLMIVTLMSSTGCMYAVGVAAINVAKEAVTASKQKQKEENNVVE